MPTSPAKPDALLPEQDSAAFRLQAEQLREKTALLETTLSSISQGIFMIDPEGRLISWNRRIKEILDLPDDLLASRPTLAEITRFQLDRGDFGPDAFHVQPHARAYVAAAGSGPAPTRYLRTTLDGRVIEVQTQTLPSGGMVRTFADVTDYVHAQEEIRRLNNELEDRVRQRTTELEGANRELDAFSYSIAHDLRQPLSSLDGFSTLLAALTPDDANTPARHYVERIRAGVRQLSALTDGLLSLAYLSRKKLHWTDFDLADMARELLGDMAAREPARRVAIDIQPELWASGEAMLMRQVLDSLLGNAWKFTVRNEQARISMGKLVNDAGETVYFVKDNGAGFDMAHAGKLFGSFQRLHSPTDFSGMGISLAIANRIIARHGGRIWARSARGEGATFSFTLGSETPVPHTADPR
ncbi:MAG: PAS-domain containing protein [Pseudomonadota bacterium]